MSLARAYVEFAVQQPALMQLMFGDDFVDLKRRFSALDRAALATFALLEEEVVSLSPRAGRGAQRLRAATAWALVHGLAELLRQGQLTHVLSDRRESDRLIPTAAALFVRGVAPNRRGLRR